MVIVHGDPLSNRLSLTAGDPTFRHDEVYRFRWSAGGGGQLSLQSDVVILENEGAISAISLGPGNSGGIDLIVRELSVTSGAEIRGQTVFSGNGADITIVASESVSLDGMSFAGNTGISVSAATAFVLGRRRAWCGPARTDD